MSSMTASGSTGVLLINLGTPDAPRTPEVRRYLREFLSDRYVLDMNPVGRFMLLYGIILPFRPAQSAEAYRKIWTEEGSPLLVHTRNLTEAVRRELEPGTPVEYGMRYGNPSMAEGLRKLRERGVDRVVALPLYPQYAESTTRTVTERLAEDATRMGGVIQIEDIPPFYDHPDFVRAFAEVGGPVLESEKPDHILLSYHGLPERQVTKLDATGTHCLKKDRCCDRVEDINRNCYRAQCYATSRLLAEELRLSPESYTVTFQSRLGRTPWIKPYTDVVIDELARRGVKRLAVFCPAFVADCLETLEELGIRGREQFLEAGGESFTLVPSLNSHPAWVKTVVALLKTKIGERARQGVSA